MQGPQRLHFHPWVGKIPWRRKQHPLQCSCLENPRDRGIWWATVHGVTKSQTRPSVHLRVLTSGNVTYPLLLYLLLYCFPNTFLTLLVYSLVSQVSTNFNKFQKVFWLELPWIYALIYIKAKSLGRFRLFVTPWTVAHQASPSMGFSRQEYWSGLPFPSP